MNKRAAWMISLVFLAALALTGVTAALGATPSEGIYPLTLVDALGRELTLEAPAERIVSLSPGATEILWAVGAGDLQVGRTEYCNYPPESEAIEVVGGFSADKISVEKIVALEADLILGTNMHVDLIPALEEAGIPIYISVPGGLRGVYAHIITVGMMADRVVEAAATIVEIDTRIFAVESALANVPAEERVTFYYEVWNDPYMTAGPASFLGKILEAAGGVNIFDDLSEGFPTISVEAIIERNPDTILGNDYLEVEGVKAREGWEAIAAVQNGAIYQLADDIMQRPGPRVAEAVETAAKALYPDLFE